MKSTVCKSSGYLMVGEWTHSETADVLQAGEIAVTEFVTDEERAAFRRAFAWQDAKRTGICVAIAA